MTCLPSEFLSFQSIFADFCRFLPIFADFCRFFSRGKRVHDTSLVPGGFEGENFEKKFKNLDQLFELKKNFQKNFLIKKFFGKNIFGFPPPLHFAFFEYFWSIFKEFSRRYIGKTLAGETKNCTRLVQALYKDLKTKMCYQNYRMPRTIYKESRVCECGYSTIDAGNWSSHKKRCKLVKSDKDFRIASLEKDKEELKEQLVAKDEHYQKELAAKDRQIEQLIKKPRTINNTTHNKIVVEQHINAFGNESIDHISQQQIQALLADPVNAVPQFIKLKHRKAPGGVNQNLRIPNQKRAIYQVVVKEGDEKEWENKSKGEVLEQLYDDNSGHLEAEADEETRVGSRFLNHQEKIRASANGEDGGRRYKEQLDKIHNVMSSV